MAALLFRDTVNRIVKEGGNNALTREALFEGLQSTTRFDADGLLGPANVAERIPSPCFVLMQVQKGAFVRVHPKRPGTLDCKKSNLIRIHEDLIA